MSTRNNEERIGATSQDSSPLSSMQQEENTPNPTVQFSTPTEFVELPSKGRFYEEGHPLHGKETVEIRFMTAKDEDILTSQSLLKKGIAIDRMLQNVIIDKSVKVQDLLVGDKNALIVAARVSGYGPDYDTKVSCPACGKKSDYSFDLEDIPFSGAGEGEFTADGATETEKGTFVLELPRSKVSVEVRLMRGKDEQDMIKENKNRKRHKMEEQNLTSLLKRIIVSINGSASKSDIANFIENMPAMDSRFIRKAYKIVTPNIDLSQEFVCESCGHEQVLEVPLTADFFWPQ
mgnify:CR=1 FL=1|tara:strand:+ start:101 stop:970 length:870 start_codon:yes stop_codon:yes gene_type:complete